MYLIIQKLCHILCKRKAGVFILLASESSWKDTIKFVCIYFFSKTIVNLILFIIYKMMMESGLMFFVGQLHI